MAYWTSEEARRRAQEVQAAFDDLMNHRRVVVRPRSKQWVFFRRCLDALLGSTYAGEQLPKAAAVQYKFEVEAKLRRYYNSPGKPLSVVFSLVSHDHAVASGDIDQNYPSTNGYGLLVSDALPHLVAPKGDREVKLYLERLVMEAALSELDAYRRLPEADLSSLERYFMRDSSAYKRIQNIVESHARSEQSISVPEHNPSTMRMEKCKVVRLEAQAAEVRTVEYWYLRWWSLRKNKVTYIYNERNHQRYHLVLVDGAWLVDANIYPPPRSITPQRG